MANATSGKRPGRHDAWRRLWSVRDDSLPRAVVDAGVLVGRVGLQSTARAKGRAAPPSLRPAPELVRCARLAPRCVGD